MQPKALSRLAIFVLIAVHMQAGPVLHQVLGRDPPPFGMGWTMYSRRGANVCAVQWYTATPSGHEPLDRLAALLVTEPWKAPSKVRHQRSLRDVKLAAQSLCKKFPGADVRARARCGVAQGHAWKQVIDTDTPLCDDQEKQP